MNLEKLESYLRVNLLGPGPRLMKNNLQGRGLTKVEKHCSKYYFIFHANGPTDLPDPYFARAGKTIFNATEYF